jgi:hypothetical protein
MTQAVSWLVSDLSSSAPVLTDEVTARRLLRAGRAAVQSDVAAWRSADYALETPQLRAEARSDSALGAALTTAVPVARFGGRADRLIVARLLPGKEAAAAAALKADARDRRTAESQLLRNGRVHIARDARGAFASGAVDLRAATLVALMARSADVTVLAIRRARAEDAAGLPVRRLSLSAGNRSALADGLAMLPPRYRPFSVAGSSVEWRLSWPVRIPPLPLLH